MEGMGTAMKNLVRNPRVIENVTEIRIAALVTETDGTTDGTTDLKMSAQGGMQSATVTGSENGRTVGLKHMMAPSETERNVNPQSVHQIDENRSTRARKRMRLRHPDPLPSRVR